MCDKKQFLAGFGIADITPEESVPMASYGDDLRRFSQGVLAPLQARAIALTDESGGSLLLLTGDLSWASYQLGSLVKVRIEEELGIPSDHVIVSGIHTHDSVSAGYDHLPEVVRYQKRYISGMFEAAKAAIADRKPAQLFIGSAITERMNFVRRYLMDDGSLIGDNAYGTGTMISCHESAADPELQLMRIVRKDGKDILVSNFQAHPHLEGKKSLLSPQAIGAFRDEVEARFGFHSLHWNGAAGNINSASRIEVETRTKEQQEWARIMADYTEHTLARMVKVTPGPIRVASSTVSVRINHLNDHLVPDAEKVVKYFHDGHSAMEAARYAWQFGIHSYYHANRIISNAKDVEHKEMLLQAFSFGDIGGVVLPYEMFDTNGMQIKCNSPLRKTFIVGYSWPAYYGYIPSSLGFQNGGYEADNCAYIPGTAEELVDHYLQLLDRLAN